MDYLSPIKPRLEEKAQNMIGCNTRPQDKNNNKQISTNKTTLYYKS